MPDFNFALDDGEELPKGKKVIASPSFFTPRKKVFAKGAPDPPVNKLSGTAVPSSVPSSLGENGPENVVTASNLTPTDQASHAAQPAGTEPSPQTNVDITSQTDKDNPGDALEQGLGTTPTSAAFSVPESSNEEHAAANAPWSDIEPAGSTEADGTSHGRTASAIEEGPANSAHGQGPLYVILALVVLLLSLSFIWFVNPFPEIKAGLEELFSTRRNIEAPRAPVSRKTIRVPDTNNRSANRAGTPDATDDTQPLREWDYFVRVASRPRNPQAQVLANALKRAGLPATTEPEFIQRYKRTFYRVKIGPYKSLLEARAIRDSIRVSFPDAFLDSARFDSSVPGVDGPPVLQPELGGKPAASVPPTAGTASNVKQASGFVVRAGAYNNRDVAEGQKNRLLQRGFPALLAVSKKTGAPLFVIDVGPFSNRRDAETYLQSIRNSVEPGAFLIEIPAGRKSTPKSTLP